MCRSACSSHVQNFTPCHLPSCLHKCTHTRLQAVGCQQTTSDSKHTRTKCYISYLRTVFICKFTDLHTNHARTVRWLPHAGSHAPMLPSVFPTYPTPLPNMRRGQTNEPLEWSTKFLALAQSFPSGHSWLPVC